MSQPYDLPERWRVVPDALPTGLAYRLVTVWASYAQLKCLLKVEPRPAIMVLADAHVLWVLQSSDVPEDLVVLYDIDLVFPPHYPSTPREWHVRALRYGPDARCAEWIRRELHK